MNNFRETLLRFGLRFLVFVLPFTYFGSIVMYPHITSKEFFFSAVTDVLAAVWIYTIIVDRSYRPSKKMLWCMVPLGLYALSMTLSAIHAVNPVLAFWSSFARGVGLLSLYHSILFLLVLVSVLKHEGKEFLYKLLRSCMGGGLILAITVWFGSAGFGMIQNDGGGGLGGNSSLTGAYLLLVLAFGAFLLSAKDVSRNVKYWTGASMLIILFSPLFIDLHGLLTSGSVLGSARGAFLGIFVAIGSGAIGYMMLSRKRSLRVVGITLGIASVCIFGFLWSQLMTPGTVIHEKFTQAASGTRFIFWDEGQKAMNERPWFGYGPENYMIAFAQYFDPKMFLPEYHYEGWNDRAHNIYYDTGVAGGYPAIVLYVFFILSILYALSEAEKNGSLSRIESSILGGVIIGYIFQDLFYFDTTLSLMGFFAIAAIAYGFASARREKDAKKGNPAKVILAPFYKQSAAFAVCIACILALIFFTYRPLQKAHAFTIVVGTSVNKPYKDLLNGSNIGNQWDVSIIAHDANNTLVQNLPLIKSNPAVLPYIEKDLMGLLAYLEEIVKTNTTDLRLYISMANLYSTEIYIDPAQNTEEHRNRMLELLNHALKLSPTNPEVYWGIAQVYAWTGDVKGVVQTYQKAISLNPHIPTTYTLLLQFAKAIKDEKLYEAELKEAQMNVPGFAI